MTTAPVIRTSDQTRLLHVIGFEIRTLLSAADTGGTYSLFDTICPREVSPPSHIHSNEDETFYVVDGEIEVLVGGKTTRLGPGGCVFGPRGIPHTFRALSQTPARVLLLVTPGGFERFFEECDRELPHSGPPDIPRLVQIMESFGMKVLG